MSLAAAGSANQRGSCHTHATTPAAGKALRVINSSPAIQETTWLSCSSSQQHGLRTARLRHAGHRLWRIWVSSSIAYLGEQHTTSTGFSEGLLILLSMEVGSGGHGCESLHSAFLFCHPPVVTFTLAEPDVALLLLVAPSWCKKQVCATVTC